MGFEDDVLSYALPGGSGFVVSFPSVGFDRT
jgi:hypothetical protein